MQNLAERTKCEMVSYGENSLSELTQALDEGNHQTILLITGRGFLERCGLSDLLAPVLHGKKILRVCEFETNPKKQDLDRILDEVREFPFTAILGIGGGSAMDMAKLVKCFKGQPRGIGGVLYNGDKPTPSDVELFAIPTTAGSGSEATHFAVVYDGGVKFSVAHEALLPSRSWVLPSVLATVPHDVAAAAAMDAFCQGVESYWCIHSTEESKELAREAAQLAWKHMLPAVNQRDPHSLAAMGKASHLAGIAINITKTTAPHAISYALTTHFGVLHGHAVGVMLPSIFCYNAQVKPSDVLDQRGVDYVKCTMLEIASMIGKDDVLSAAGAIRERMMNLKLTTSLQDIGVVGEEGQALIIRDGFNPGRVNNNPRRLTEQSLRDLLGEECNNCK